ncbi:MAG TPA: Ig-like domain-containing protein [Puia sp.]
MKRTIWILLLIYGVITGHLQAQTTASFNFSLAAHPVTGWVNVAGDPSTAIRTGVSGGITISSIATANWAPYNSVAAFDGGGMSGATFFPAAVMANMWFQYSAYYASYNAALPQLEISGLSIDSVYTLQMTVSFNATTFNFNPTRYTVTGATVYGYSDVYGNSNVSGGAVFHNIAPDANGKIRVYVNTASISGVSSNTAGISGLQITSGHTATPVPTVSITNPSDNDILPEDGNITLSATASETGGTIAKVEFYVDTTKIGEDSTAPYSMTWNSPDAGLYTLKARAIDGLGNTNTATVNINVESLSSFWSMTGNIHMNADSNFVGNVDSVRLAFRTKNLERMSISPLGNVGIGTIAPSAQLHTTGTVRLAGLTSDSTKNRVLVSDTSGNLFYRNVSSLSNRWVYANGLLYDSSDNIAIGTSNAQGYKLAVNGTAIFTKVRVKTAGTWPDYVFQKGYALPDLGELERYITEHRHLPGIVSEAEVQRDGIDIGDHQAALLKRIEEMTLYLIEENKKLKEQNRQLELQNSHLEQQQQEIDELKKLIREKK